MTALPIESVLGDLRAALSLGPACVLQAPPGAGKTTRVPLALLSEPWLAERRILMLEPRRLVARAAAGHMARLLNEAVGLTVGFRVRMETRVGPQTRIEVLTEGVLTRRLQSDPALSGVGLVIFDEFHERHFESDLGLALCLDLQGVLNPQLRLLVMSATLDTGPVAELLGAAPVVTCEGRQYAVETRYRGLRREVPVERAVADAVLAAARGEQGSILAFLPGAPEIRRTLALLQAAGLGPEWLLAPLFGNLSREEQEQAVLPAPPGRRKIVLATNIAESSLTIEGIRVVVDGGLARVPRFEARSGMTRLATVPVSRASADQRRGRAGRSGPGVCVRLWSEQAQQLLPERSLPEILQADLAQLALELAVWGVRDPQALKWLDLPPPAAFTQARRLLQALGALSDDGSVSDHGRQMAGLPLHPRLAHMLLEACRRGQGAAGCDLAALLSEGDVMRFGPGERDADIRLRLDAMAAVRQDRRPESGAALVDRSACRRAVQLADVLRRRLGVPAGPSPSAAAGRLLALAYPDRIGRRRPGAAGRFLLTNGRGAFFPSPEPLSSAETIVAAELDGERREARIFLAAAYDEADLLEDFAAAVETVETVAWDPRRQAVSTQTITQLGALVLKAEAMPTPDPQAVAAALIEGIRQAGIGCLPWTRRLREWQQRVLFLRRAFEGEESWPDVGDAALADSMADWLSPHIGGVTRLGGLRRVDLPAALAGLLTREQRRRLESLAPTHLAVPSGARIRLDYSGEAPVLAARVQEMFGSTDTPRVAGGRRAVRLHLLAPSGRPVQVTEDLAGFWAGSYHQVKKELKGRYPKHPWPDDPLAAQPTRSVRSKKG
jgi:ATP-dependent helicase HrpB